VRNHLLREDVFVKPRGSEQNVCTRVEDLGSFTYSAETEQ